MVAAHATSEPSVDLGLGTLTAASIGSATALYAESVEQLEAEWPASARVARALGVGAVACVPFRVGDRAGALSVVLAEPRPFGPEERTFLELLATACQQGLERASLYEAERTARTRADSLHELSSALSGALSPEDVGRAFLDHALGLVSGGTGALMLADAENRMLVRAAIGGSGSTRGLWLPSVPVDGAFVIATAYRRQAPVAAATRAELEERFPGTAANFGEHARAAYARPLVVEGRAIGDLGLIFEQEEELTADDERLLATMARICAQAYERAQLYEREHRIALRLQQALLRRRSSATQRSRSRRATRRGASSWRSAATGTTRSRSRTDASAWRWATSSAGESRRRPRWAGSGARWPRWPSRVRRPET